MISLFPLSAKGIMCSYACMLETIDTTKDSFINRMMARNSDFIALATEKKNKPKTVEELECDFNRRCSIFPPSCTP